MRAAIVLIGALLGCTAGEPPASEKPKAPADAPKPAVGKKVEIGKNVYFEVTPDGRRRVSVPAEVSFREGPLELFLCRKFTKEHEAVVAADIDARDLHKALLAAGAVAGSPVQFQPTYKPARGSVVKVSVAYSKDGKDVTADARSWIRDAKTRKPLDKDWVFAGSHFFEDPEDPKKPKLYAANGGDIVCVSNFSTAMLDLPIASSAENEELMFEALTENIPPLGTKLTIIFEPQPEPPAAKGKK
jgi:hypothetical protein